MKCVELCPLALVKQSGSFALQRLKSWSASSASCKTTFDLDLCYIEVNLALSCTLSYFSNKEKSGAVALQTVNITRYFTSVASLYCHLGDTCP